LNQKPQIRFVPVGAPESAPANESGSGLDLPGLKELALRSLAVLFNENEQLFCRHVTLTDAGFQRAGTSPKCTIIALLGLQHLADSGVRQPFDLTAIQNAVLRDTSWVKSIGELGLLTRFIAECVPDRLATLLRDFDLGAALEAKLDNKQGRTTELGDFLAGGAHARLACPDVLPDLMDVAVDAYHSLADSQSDGGIFGYAASPGFLRRSFSNRFGTFADQVHAIYALATFARAFQIEEPIAPALNCANAIRALQGESGQWWFSYDKHECRVVNHYPVHSQYQDALAPIALLALGEVTGQNFNESIRNGLSWVAGGNELGMDFRNFEHGVIWESLEPTGRIANYSEAALSLLNVSRRLQAKNLRIRLEATTAHFGWLLYAVGRFGVPSAVMAAKAAAAR
jgi:hypothetical protein